MQERCGGWGWKQPTTARRSRVNIFAPSKGDNYSLAFSNTIWKMEMDERAINWQYCSCCRKRKLWGAGRLATAWHLLPAEKATARQNLLPPWEKTCCPEEKLVAPEKKLVAPRKNVLPREKTCCPWEKTGCPQEKRTASSSPWKSFGSITFFCKLDLFKHCKLYHNLI